MKGPGFKPQDAPPIGGVAVLAAGKREPVAGAEPSAAPRACGATGVKSYGQGPEEGVKERLQELQARHAAQGVDAWFGGPQGVPPFARLTLSRIFVPKESRGRGVGTSFMKDLVAMADEEGLAITLTPDTSFGSSSVSRLKAFYKRFGFYENKGRHKDWTISETMIRYPFGRDCDLPHVVKSLPLAVGQGFRTGKPADLPWMHNEAPSAKVSWAGQEVEPAGFYVINRFDLAPDREPLPGWAYGEGHLACPLVLAFGGGYLEPSNWKRALSEAYGGLVGKALTRALLRDGFDSIVTVDKERESLSEIVLLNRTAQAPRRGPLDFASDPAWHDLFYGQATPERISELETWLTKNPGSLVRLYHGTDAQHPILETGLLPTNERRAKSLQSGHGYVYLSVYPGMAGDFGRMAYPGRQIQVYSVEVPVRSLLPDLDQLRNRRMWDKTLIPVGSTLAESLVIGHGARVKGKILPLRVAAIECQ